MDIEITYCTVGEWEKKGIGCGMGEEMGRGKKEEGLLFV